MIKNSNENQNKKIIKERFLTENLGKKRTPLFVSQFSPENKDIFFNLLQSTTIPMKSLRLSNFQIKKNL